MNWQPIKTAPRDKFVLLYVPNGQLETGPVTIGSWYRWEDRDENGRFKSGKWFQGDWNGWLGIDGDAAPSWCEPTHWMQLPEPPTRPE